MTKNILWVIVIVFVVAATAVLAQTLLLGEVHPGVTGGIAGAVAGATVISLFRKKQK